MRTISCKLEDLKTMTLHIGYESENDYTSVRIDAGSVFAEYPQAVPSLKVQPPKGSTYPVNVTRDGTVVIWNVKESDTANNGNGEGQMTFTDGEVVKKCQPFKIIVHRSLKGNGTAPDPVQDWIEEASGIVEAAEEAAQNAEAAAAHAPIIGLDGYWYRWDAEAEEYVSTGTQAQGPEGEQGQPGEPGDPTELIDDTDPAANKTFSSSKIDTELTNVKSALQGKQDAPETAGSSGQVLGLATENNEVVPKWVDQPSVPSSASSAQIKGGTDTTHFITPSEQDRSLFYALSKLAGVDLASGSETVGVYSDASKVAIQKMIGVYESPWELIREDTVTNATEEDIVISVDGNGQAFELTDVALLFELPKQTTQASKGYYGQVQYFNGSTAKHVMSSGAWTQNANDNAKGFYHIIERKGGLIFKTNTTNAVTGANAAYYMGYAEGLLDSSAYTAIVPASDSNTITKVNIKSVTGKGHYKLYGKRKWN